MDHAYFGWKSEVGSSISRGLFAAAQFRPRVPPDAGFYGLTNKIGGDRMNGLTSTVGDIFGQF